jgi:hypothetical protein
MMQKWWAWKKRFGNDPITEEWDMAFAKAIGRISNWEKQKAEFQELIVKEDWDSKFEAAYRKRQAQEWNQALKTEKLCEDAVMAILTLFNEEITEEERQRRWKTLPNRGQRRAYYTANAASLSLRMKYWSYDFRPGFGQLAGR